MTVREVVTAAQLGLENERLCAEGLAQVRALADSRVRIIEAGDRNGAGSKVTCTTVLGGPDLPSQRLTSAVWRSGRRVRVDSAGGSAGRSQRDAACSGPAHSRRHGHSRDDSAGKPQRDGPQVE